MAGGGAALVRKLWQAATFSYDGLQYKGREVQPITPNDQFYCVTKNVVDPKVNAALWRLEVTGLVKTAQRYGLGELQALPACDAGDDLDVHQQRARCRPDEQRALERRAHARAPGSRGSASRPRAK